MIMAMDHFARFDESVLEPGTFEIILVRERWNDVSCGPDWRASFNQCQPNNGDERRKSFLARRKHPGGRGNGQDDADLRALTRSI
jgi:hypothetical protein